MKEFKISGDKLAVIVFLLSVISFAATAQKLPNVQTTSIWAPAALKIDGNATEWDNKYQAYNSATELFYSLSNDDKRLYLVIHANDPAIVKKIVGGGISFTINRSGKKDEKNAPGFTFPVFNKKNNMRLIKYKNLNSTTGTNSAVAYPDSIIAVNNKNLLNISNMIRVKDVKDVDTLISIYNDQGIKTAILFDDKMSLTLEMAIDLKLINILPGSSDKFLYHIQSNGISLEDMGVISHSATGAIQVRMGIVNRSEANLLPSTTDFWGTYQLATK